MSTKYNITNRLQLELQQGKKTRMTKKIRNQHITTVKPIGSPKLVQTASHFRKKKQENYKLQDTLPRTPQIQDRPPEFFRHSTRKPEQNKFVCTRNTNKARQPRTRNKKEQ